jgi:hypothetical protein
MAFTYADVLEAKRWRERSAPEEEALAAVEQGPLGYQSGGRVSYANNNFVVAPFVMNVNGHMVVQKTQTAIAGEAWSRGGIKTLRVPGMYYYLYVGGEGDFFVTNVAPQWDAELMAWYHRDYGERLLGLCFLDVQTEDFDKSGEMIYASSQLEVDTHEVTVVASDYVGEDYDYRCDGVADEEEINHAIRYMARPKGEDIDGNELPGGGIVHLSPGTFNLSGEISMLGSITLEGSGYGTRIIPDSTADAQSHGIHVPGTSASPIDGCVIRDLRVQRSARNAEGSGTVPRDIFAEYANDMIIQNNWVIDSPILGISVTYSKDFLVSGNIVRDVYVVGSAGQSIDLGAGDSDTLLSGRVVNNEVYNTAATAAPLTGILVNSPGTSLIANNVVRNFLCNSTNAVRGIQVRSSACTVSGNLLFDFRNSHDGTDGCYAIEVRDAPNCHVVGNTIRDIHGFPNSSLNQAGVGVYLTREGSAVPNDAHIASNFIHGCDQGIFISETTINRVMLSGNQVYDCGQLIYYGHHEDVDDEPILIADAGGAATLSNATWARSDEQAYEGSYSYKITKSGAGHADAHLHNGTGTTDMHGLILGTEYTLEAWFYVPSSGGPSSLAEAELWLTGYVSGSWAGYHASPLAYNAWEKVSVTLALASTATGTRLSVRMDSAASAGEYFYVDNIRLYPTKHQNVHENLLKDEGTGTRF